MKRIFAVILVLSMIFALSACKKNDKSTPNSSVSSDISTTQNDNNSTISNNSNSTTTDDENAFYYENTISPNVCVEIKDEDGNVLLVNNDISMVMAMFMSQENQYAIQLDMTTSGTEKLKTATEENLGKTMPIYVDGNLIFSPTVNDVISDGKVLLLNFESKEKMLDLYYSLTLENPITAITELPLEKDTVNFYFSSGAGAWYSSIVLNKDGSFTGEYRNSDADGGEDKEWLGTLYSSSFSGTFGNFEKVNDYTYKMTLLNLETAEEVGKVTIEENIRYISADAQGLTDGTDFVLYLPNTPQSELSEEFLQWCPDQYLEESDILSCYGILNVATNIGFFG